MKVIVLIGLVMTGLGVYMLLDEYWFSPEKYQDAAVRKLRVTRAMQAWGSIVVGVSLVASEFVGCMN
jgi:NADH:ubiquinone oxidoreductase subunit 5 (subunit L)/multisubunit Na+/H+ antiporter MnhA subunit